MAAYIKELLFDLVQDRVDIDMKADLYNAIKLASHIFPYTLIKQLDMLLSGYTVKEIAEIYNVVEDTITANLYRLVSSLEVISGFSDEKLVYLASQRSPTPQKLEKFRIYLREQSKVF